MSEEIKSVTRFLKESPPGEYEDVVAALKGFVENTEIIDEGIKATKEDWLIHNCSTIEIDDHKAILCEEARRGKNKFIDPVTNKVFTYDFENQTIVTPEPQPAAKGEEPQPVEEETLESSSLREAIQPLALAFAKSTVHNGTCGTYDSKNGVKIVVRASTINKANFRTGIILMHFTCAEGNLKGSIELKGHFYEKGNCIGTQVSEFEDTYQGDDDGAKAEDIVKKLSKFFIKWNNALTQGFELLNSEGLNKLRRRLPINAQKINWQQELRGLGAMQK
ncbi:F-actin capping protein alpha subunit, putative [Trichomonas vaginalis G3]|uniref:F-actin-capping protein subunit alpha n=1 Tax=Trichomonas vaginalis (strain ATCC PRA-98 / G3) TaxID=412133 RepID=A2E2L7_TRIV3|nr:barbed-end actin filament capping [Trichomonas vaginalis G3]EAY13045.1 F-actin capping protein alpha subunit, putative [Trichomonas vaginalis G3]KAI5548234.1 barbed-end actin filament capping [Trichomonas vaginalis G3]|eukprot:XP_001325268.1 F-actin capping protein alpha subunit [Trichomonas vaginalis G3]